MAEPTRFPTIREFHLVPVRDLDGSELVADGGEFTHITRFGRAGVDLANGRTFSRDARVAVWFPSPHRKARP